MFLLLSLITIAFYGNFVAAFSLEDGGVFFGLRLARLRASDRIHSICPLVLRNSSAAHFSMASYTSESTLSANDFFIVANCYLISYGTFGEGRRFCY